MIVSGILHQRHDLFLALMMTAGLLGEPRQSSNTIVILHVLDLVSECVSGFERFVPARAVSKRAY